MAAPIKIAATMLDGSYLGKPLRVPLDSRYSGYGGSSFQVRGLSLLQSSSQSRRKSIKDLGLDEAGYMVWSLDKQATVDEVIMSEKTNPRSLKPGDRISSGEMVRCVMG